MIFHANLYYILLQLWRPSKRAIWLNFLSRPLQMGPTVDSSTKARRKITVHDLGPRGSGYNFGVTEIIKNIFCKQTQTLGIP